MENNTVTLEVISPEGEIFKNVVDQVTVPTAMGEITVLAGHAPLFAKVVDGEIVIKSGVETAFVAITGGFIEVLNNTVSILANYAIRSEKIEERRAEEARKRAEATLREQKGKREFTSAEIELKKSMLQLKIAEKYRKRGGKHAK